MIEKELRLRRMRNATMAQLVSVAFSSVGFITTGNSAYSAEIYHSSGDALVHGSRYVIEKANIPQTTWRYRMFLRAGLLLSSSLAGWTAYKAGVHLYDGIVPTYTMPENMLHLTNAVVIAGTNTYAHRQFSSIEEHSYASKIGLFHTAVDKYTSWGIAGSLALEAVSVQNASLYGTVVFGGTASLALAYEAATLHDSIDSDHEKRS